MQNDKFAKLEFEGNEMMNKEELMDYLQKEPVDTLITFGAGNIDRYIGPITEMLCQRQQGI